MRPSTLRVLKLMAENKDTDDGELVQETRQTWIGNEQVGGAIVNELLRLVAIKDVSGSETFHRYVINSTGEALLRRPQLEQELQQVLLTGRPFRIYNDKVLYNPERG